MIRCDLNLIEGDTPSQEDEDHDTLESKLVVRLHCKHGETPPNCHHSPLKRTAGVIKTHRLLLSTPTTLMAPGVPDTAEESFLTVGPRPIRDIIEHFPPARGKSDPQVVWSFGESEIEVRSWDSSGDARGMCHS